MVVYVHSCVFRFIVFLRVLQHALSGNLFYARWRFGLSRRFLTIWSNWAMVYYLFFEDGEVVGLLGKLRVLLLPGRLREHRTI